MNFKCNLLHKSIFSALFEGLQAMHTQSWWTGLLPQHKSQQLTFSLWDFLKLDKNLMKAPVNIISHIPYIFENNLCEKYNIHPWVLLFMTL